MGNGKIPPEWVRTILIIIIQLLALVVWGAILDTEVGNHIDDLNVHMPLSETIQTFVPRTEIDVRLLAIENSLTRIESAVGVIKQ